MKMNQHVKMICDPLTVKVSELTRALHEIHDTVIVLCDTPLEYETEEKRRIELLCAFDIWVNEQSANLAMADVEKHQAFLGLLLSEHNEKELQHFKNKTAKSLYAIHLKMLDILREWGPPIQGIAQLREHRKRLIDHAKTTFKNDDTSEFMIDLYKSTLAQVRLENIKFQISE